MSELDNYLALRDRVDELCAGTCRRLAAEISCRPGCDACCRHLSIFAVEAAALAAELETLPALQADLIRRKAAQAGADTPCPLLHEGLCLLYRARPIICRTHGLPLLIAREDGNEIDFCPENFRGLKSIPGADVIDLERLNALLAAINAVYLKTVPDPERLTMAEALAHGDNR